MTNLEKTYAKWFRDDQGRSHRRFSAIDPADGAVVCTCGKPGCFRARLLPFREHIAELYRTLLQLHMEQIAVEEPCDWTGVLYGLKVAASIDDIDADTGYVEDPMTYALCEPTIDYDRAESEMTSKYVAAATIFNFLWQAYEAVVGVTAPNELTRLLKEQRLGERGRRLFEAHPEVADQFPGVKDLTTLALLQCKKGGRMDDRCSRIGERFGGAAFITAAELCREFRNFIYHGGDEVPGHEDWGSVVLSRCRIFRFYSISRLILLLIQGLCWLNYVNQDGYTLLGAEDEELLPTEIIKALHFKNG